jgi:hypothetical protein
MQMLVIITWVLCSNGDYPRRACSCCRSQHRVPVIYKFSRCGICHTIHLSLFLLTADADKLTIFFEKKFPKETHRRHAHFSIFAF